MSRTVVNAVPPGTPPHPSHVIGPSADHQGRPMPDYCHACGAEVGTHGIHAPCQVRDWRGYRKYWGID